MGDMECTEPVYMERVYREEHHLHHYTNTLRRSKPFDRLSKSVTIMTRNAMKLPYLD